jgi:hypothetical protein
MKTMSRWMVGAVGVIALTWAGASRAEVAGKTGEIEIFGGEYFPGGNSNLDGPIYGVRGGWNSTDHFGFQGSLEHYSKTKSGAKLEGWWLDFPFEYHFNPKARAVFLVSGGPGYMNAKLSVSAPSPAHASNDQWTLNAGFGAKIRLGKKFYVRPDARWHWYSDASGSGDDTDWEATVAFAWTLGK